MGSGIDDEPKEVGMFTQDCLQKMKRAGKNKPDGVTWSQWLGPAKITSRHNLVCHLAAVGLRNIDIARETGLSESRISVLLNDPKIINEVKYLQRQLYGDDPKRRFQILMNESIDVTHEIMRDKGQKGSTRLSAAQIIQERVLGKTTQTFDIGSNLIRGLLERLDKQSKPNDPIDVTPKEEEPKLLTSLEAPQSEKVAIEESKNLVDNWIEEHLGEKTDS